MALLMTRAEIKKMSAEDVLKYLVQIDAYDHANGDVSYQPGSEVSRVWERARVLSGRPAKP